MSFERTCTGCRDFRVGPGEQQCERCGEINETLWRWMESRPCSRCGRDTRIVDPVCDRCQRALRAARYRERAEKRNGQIRLC